MNFSAFNNIIIIIWRKKSKQCKENLEEFRILCAEKRKNIATQLYGKMYVASNQPAIKIYLVLKAIEFYLSIGHGLGENLKFNSRKIKLLKYIEIN